MLLETDKKYKLVLQAQEVFEGYCTQVRNEGFSKEIEIPLAFQNEEISGHNLKKDNFYWFIPTYIPGSTYHRFSI